MLYRPEHDLRLFFLAHMPPLTAVSRQRSAVSATAVKFNDELPGAYVTHRNEKYLICDPTYINAEIGMVMSRYKDVKPELTELPGGRKKHA